MYVDMSTVTIYNDVHTFMYVGMSTVTIYNDVHTLCMWVCLL